MVKKAEIETALKNAGLEVYDETPGEHGGWTFLLDGIPGAHYDGHVEAVIAGLQSVEELERLVKVFNPPKD